MPSASVDASRFYLYDEITAYLRGVAEEFPGLVRLESIGKSFEGRDIWLLEVTNAATGPASEKPATWVDANIHAGEVTASVSALCLIETLTTGYGSDEAVTRLLDRSAFYIVPRLNPDGAELYLTTPTMLRSSVRPYPFEDEREGLYPYDVDGDGLILQMRVPDQKGAWKVSARDPRLMRPRGHDEEGGSYYRLMPEGMVRDYNGFTFNPAPARHGLDLNRSFPYDWAPEGEQRGAGPHPLSEPETRAVAEFFAAHPNINAVQTYHTMSGVLLRPYDDKPDDAFPTHDLGVYKALGQRGTELTGWPHESVFHGFRYDPKSTTHGGFDTWAYDHLGIFAFTNELWDPIGMAGVGTAGEHGVMKRDFIGWFREHPEEDDLKVLAFHDQHELGLYHAWRRFEHPQLGEVEIGGWDHKRFWQNAPAKFLPDVARRNALFTLSHAAANPRLRVKRLEAHPVAGDAYRVVCVLENDGFLPTYTSARAQERKAVQPIRVTLALPEGGVLVSGERAQDAGQLEGRSNKRHGESGATDQERKLEWVVRAPAGSEVRVEAVSQRAGTARGAVTLG
ncbi:MAG TPA: M14 family metallopeptidase [Deinococcales bacterium]|nr:M14 family metallopeptidase [Deinococcales bacterium]